MTDGCHGMQSVTSQQQLCGLEGQSAEGLMQAIENLPTQEDMDQFASSSEASRSRQSQSQGQAQGQGGQQGLDGNPVLTETAHSGKPAGQGWAGGGGGGGGDNGAQQRWQVERPRGGADASRRSASGEAGLSGSWPGSPVGSGAGARDGSRGRQGTRSPSPDDVPPRPAGPIWAGIKSGSALGVEIDGSVLERAPSIPRPTHKHVVRRVQQLRQPQDFVDYWNTWKVGLAGGGGGGLGWGLGGWAGLGGP